MVDTTDVQGYRRKYDNQMGLLKSADIDEADREAIHDFVVHLRSNGSDVESLGTVVGHVNRLRLSAERSHDPITGFDDVDDVNAFKLHLEDVHGLSEGTIRNYMKTLRKFLLWQDLDWADGVTVGPPVGRKHDPSEEITADELDAMLEAANDFDSAPREKALIAPPQGHRPSNRRHPQHSVETRRLLWEAWDHHHQRAGEREGG